MPGSDLAERTAALLSLAAATDELSLSQLADLAASQVAGCVASNVTVWRQGELVSVVSSHPDAARLVGVQIAAGRGPLIETAARGDTVSCPDTLTEARWPEFATTALQMSIRSCVALSYHDQAVVTLSLFGLRPRALDHGQLQLAELLVAYGGALVDAVAEYGHSRRLADQLRDAAGARAVVDQAKGILMHALGCTADQALDRMRQVSQHNNIRAVEVAQRIIDAHAGPASRRRAQLTELARLSGATTASRVSRGR
ncbi:MAG TPA: ANTAR domain-containing protein [Streptosporangiaceae bacterium]|nr:ANTAR domain-containing protein [Streptosporangiaceae bacterium]